MATHDLHQPLMEPVEKAGPTVINGRHPSVSDQLLEFDLVAQKGVGVVGEARRRVGNQADP